MPSGEARLAGRVLGAAAGAVGESLEPRRLPACRRQVGAGAASWRSSARRRWPHGCTTRWSAAPPPTRRRAEVAARRRSGPRRVVRAPWRRRRPGARSPPSATLTPRRSATDRRRRRRRKPWSASAGIGQRRVGERVGRGMRYGAGHVGHAVVDDALLEVDRVVVRGRTRRLGAPALIDRDVDQRGAGPHARRPAGATAASAPWRRE